MKFTASFAEFGIDVNRFKVAFSAALEEQFKEALRAYLLAVIKKIPIWTGTAQGTLRPLGRFLNQELPINPVATLKNRGPAVGEGLGTFEFAFGGINPQVSIHMDLLYYNYNEFHNANAEHGFHLINPGPWLSQKAGKEAFQAYLRKNLKKNLPNITSYRTTTRIEVT